MATRINVMIPDALLKRAHHLIDDGFFSNFSEMIREGLRKEIRDYEGHKTSSEEEKKIIELIKEAHKKGKKLTVDEMLEYFEDQDVIAERRMSDIRKGVKVLSEKDLDNYLKKRGVKIVDN